MEPRDRASLDVRERGVYLLVGRSALEEAPLHLCEWLNTWGGPAIYEGCPKWPASSELLDLLKGLGRPAIVAAVLEFVNVVPEPLGQVFARAALKLPGAAGAVCYKAPVSSEHIYAIWHPGDSEYDRYPELPH